MNEERKREIKEKTASQSSPKTGSARAEELVDGKVKGPMYICDHLINGKHLFR